MAQEQLHAAAQEAQQLKLSPRSIPSVVIEREQQRGMSLRDAGNSSGGQSDAVHRSSQSEVPFDDARQAQVARTHVELRAIVEAMRARTSVDESEHEFETESSLEPSIETS